MLLSNLENKIKLGIFVFSITTPRHSIDSRHFIYIYGLLQNKALALFSGHTIVFFFKLSRFDAII
jgi:hypothetical protein